MRGTHEYRVYKKACMTAALAATQAAREAGDSDDGDSKHRARRCGLPRAVPAPPSHKDRTRRLPRLRLGRRGRQKAYGGARSPPPSPASAATPPPTRTAPAAPTFTLNQGHGQICYDVTWTALDVVSGLHVHTASNNAIVVPLDADTVLSDGSAKGCVNGIAKNLIKAIRQHPEQYYVNVHTNTYTAGAIRGTLKT